LLEVVPSCPKIHGRDVLDVDGIVSNVTSASTVWGRHADTPVIDAPPPAKSAPVEAAGRDGSVDPGVTLPVIVATTDPTSSVRVVPEGSSNRHLARGVSASCSARYVAIRH
jgi:hypothetical protein